MDRFSRIKGEKKKKKQNMRDSYYSMYAEVFERFKVGLYKYLYIHIRRFT